jgi:hypothetical protein
LRTNAPVPSPIPAAASPGAPAPAPAPRPAGGPVAPPWPGLSQLRDLTGLTGQYRADVHRRNVRIREADAREYARYLETYLAGARRCRTARELRAYGEAARPDAGLERGARLSEHEDLNRPFQQQRSAHLKASRAVADIQLRLDGRPVPLDVFFDASLAARIDVGGRTLGGALSARGGAVPEAGLAGVTVQPGRIETGVDAGVAGVKTSFARGRVESVEVSVRAAPGVRAFAKQSAGAVEHGLAVGGTVGGKEGAPAVRVEARGSIGVTLLTPEVVQRALSPKSWWDEGGK